MPDIVRGNSPQYIPVKQPDIIKPSAYANSTPSVHTKGYTNGHHFNGSGTLSGAAAGSGFGPWGAAIGAAVGLGTDIWQAIYAKKRAKEANEESKKAADAAAARNSAEARAARNYNSEQAQIRRMRMAGLSPGLAYGQMSPSTAQAPTIDKQDVNKADTPKFDNESLLHAIQLLINQQNANTQAAAQVSAANLQGSQADLNRIEQGYKAQLGLANIASLISSKELNDQQKINMIAKLLPEVELLESQANATDANARQSNANANVVEQTGIPFANSQISANYANARNFNANANVTEQTGVDLANSQIFNNNTSGLLHEQMREQMEYQYHLDKDQMSALQDFMKSHGIDSSYAPVVLAALQSIAAGSGTTVNKAFDDLIHLPFNLIKTHIDYIMSARNSLMNIIK